MYIILKIGKKMKKKKKFVKYTYIFIIYFHNDKMLFT